MNAFLASVVASYPAVYRPLSPPESLGNAGGMSGARLWRYPSTAGLLVVRAWPMGVDRTQIELIHSWLKHAEKLCVVPIPLSANGGRTVQEHGGVCWEVCPWMPGAACLESPPTAGKVASAFATLAAFHLAMGNPQESDFCPGLATRSLEIKTLVRGDLATLKRSVLSHPDDPLRVLAMRWLDCAQKGATKLEPEISRMACVRTPVQPVIRDARPDHFLFTGDAVTGLVDFGAMAIDAVSADLARLLSEWIEPNPILRSLALTSYERVRPLAPVELTLIDGYERSAALLGGGRWIKWHFLDRISFDNPKAVRLGLERGVERIERLIAG